MMEAVTSRGCMLSRLLPIFKLEHCVNKSRGYVGRVIHVPPATCSNGSCRARAPGLEPTRLFVAREKQDIVEEGTRAVCHVVIFMNW